MDLQESIQILVLCFLSLLKASRAIYGSVVGGLEGDLCLSAAVCAYSSEILTRSLAGVLLGIAASLASLRLVQKALLGIESLLACGENKLVAAILANKGFINVLFVFNFYCCGGFVLEHVW
jgi:uncharacterized membrane protein